MTQPIAITATTIPLADRHSPAELSACSVSSIDWSASSASASSDPDQSDHDGNPDHLGSPHRTPGKSSHRASLALTDLSSTTAALSVVSSSEDDQSPCISPSRARVLSGSTAPTSLLSDDKPEVLDSSDEDDELSRGGRGMAASVPNTPAFRRAGTGGKKGENRPRAQTDVARRGSRQLNLGMLEGAAADELASWVSNQIGLRSRPQSFAATLRLGPATAHTQAELVCRSTRRLHHSSRVRR